MTPKEKAIELYNKMYETGFKPKSVLIRTEQAKECTLIAVDEIAKCTKYEKQQFENDRFSEDYWNEVKKEIEAL